MDIYSFADVSFFVQGNEITGYDDGDDVITLDRLNDSASHIMGLGGKMTVSLSDDRSGSAVFRLMATSNDNIIMTQLISSQENGLFIPIFAQMKDNRNKDLGSGTQGYILKPAPMTRGRNVQAQEWTIVLERLDLLHKGGGL